MGGAVGGDGIAPDSCWDDSMAWTGDGGDVVATKSMGGGERRRCIVEGRIGEKKGWSTRESADDYLRGACCRSNRVRTTGIDLIHRTAWLARATRTTNDPTCSRSRAATTKSSKICFGTSWLEKGSQMK